MSVLHSLLCLNNGPVHIPTFCLPIYWLIDIWLVSTLAILHSIAMNICTQRLVSVPVSVLLGTCTHGFCNIWSVYVQLLENGGEISVSSGLIRNAEKTMLLKTACNAVEAIPYEYSRAFFTEAKKSVCCLAKLEMFLN